MTEMSRDMPSVAELARRALDAGRKISDIVLMDEVSESGAPVSDVRRKMGDALNVMRSAVERGIHNNLESMGGLVGGDARKVEKARAQGRLIGGTVLDLAIARAMACAEVNAAMGRIVAAPTAGSCGVLPGVLLTVAEAVGASDDELIAALFTAAGVGKVIAARASLSGAEGGCQAEIGSAACMAAAAAVELAGGGPDEVCHGGAIALKGLLGLVCDPVGGLVEVPCVKRNATAAAVALASADMALAGIKSVIPIDEVISAMGKVGRMLPCALRETAEGGLAETPTGRRLALMSGREDKVEMALGRG